MKTAQELTTNAQYYAKHPFLMAASLEMGGIENILQTLVVESRAFRTQTESAEELILHKIQDEGRQTRRARHWGSMLQVLAVSNIIQRDILCIYPPDVESYAKPLFNGLVKPSTERDVVEVLQQNPTIFVHPIVINWTRDSNLDNNLPFEPNHVVPLTFNFYFLYM